MKGFVEKDGNSFQVVRVFMQKVFSSVFSLVFSSFSSFMRQGLIPHFMESSIDHQPKQRFKEIVFFF